MNGAITVLGKMETQLAEILQLPATEQRGVISTTLWKSKRFQKIVRSTLDDTLVYDDILGRHPAELIYAWLAFFYVPLLTILVSANRAADELHSGSVRYMITRTTRLEWTLGKYIGLSILLLAGIGIGATAAWVVAIFRLAGADIPALFPALLGWSLKAWIYSFPYLGLALGISHLSKSGAKATAISVTMLVPWYAAPILIEKYGGRFATLANLFPGAVENSLWRASFTPVTFASLWLIALSLLYLSIGAAVFMRSDAR
jgi:ABC-type transport system involved in multi-copper enzyme maturation permease subunit